MNVLGEALLKCCDSADYRFCLDSYFGQARGCYSLFLRPQDKVEFECEIGCARIFKVEKTTSTPNGSVSNEFMLMPLTVAIDGIGRQGSSF